MTFYNILNNGVIFFKTELITNFHCDRGYYLRCKQTEIVNEMMDNFKTNKNKQK